MEQSNVFNTTYMKVHQILMKQKKFLFDVLTSLKLFYIIVSTQK